jgi:SAM-dependent methyltransferase
MKRLQDFIQHSSMFRLFEPFIPGDHHRTSSAEEYARDFVARTTGSVNVLDLGCGAGDSKDFFSGFNAQCQWHGAEVAESPELRAAGRTDRPITFFDGVHLPWQDGYFNLVYSHQVLEHVRRPEALLADVARVLKPGGALAGSVSYLEPYHSLSLFNYTPYGLITVLQDAGLHVAELRPGNDCWSVIARQMAGGHRGLSMLLSRLSPLNAAVGIAGLLCGLDHKARNFLKIQFAGHLVFLAYKDAA